MCGKQQEKEKSRYETPENSCEFGRIATNASFPTLRPLIKSSHDHCTKRKSRTNLPTMWLRWTWLASYPRLHPVTHSPALCRSAYALSDLLQHRSAFAPGH